ncbi:MAG: FliM/FliN family flagellar motor switch protein [Bacillota bacterium]
MSESLNQEELDAMLKNLAGSSGDAVDGRHVFDAAAYASRPESSLKSESAEPLGKNKMPLVQRVDFPQLKPRPQTSIERPDRRIFHNIPLILSGELGTAEMTVKDLLELEEGSVVKLDKMAGESATVLVNEQYLGQAEIVVVNDRFGLRITAIGKEKTREEKEEQEKGRFSPGQPAAKEREQE